MNKEAEEKLCPHCDNPACTMEEYDTEIASVYGELITVHMIGVYCLACIKELVEDEQSTHKRQMQ